MIVLIKSGPETVEGKRAVQLASDAAADLVLLQNGAYFARKGVLEGFAGKTYLLDEDARLRGLTAGELRAGTKALDYDSLVELMAGEDKVVGMF